MDDEPNRGTQADSNLGRVISAIRKWKGHGSDAVQCNEKVSEIDEALVSVAEVVVEGAHGKTHVPTGIVFLQDVQGTVSQRQYEVDDQDVDDVDGERVAKTWTQKKSG